MARQTERHVFAGEIRASDMTKFGEPDSRLTVEGMATTPRSGYQRCLIVPVDDRVDSDTIRREIDSALNQLRT